MITNANANANVNANTNAMANVNANADVNAVLVDPPTPPAACARSGCHVRRPASSCTQPSSNQPSPAQE